jgi:hypothetical protein
VRFSEPFPANSKKAFSLVVSSRNGDTPLRQNVHTAFPVSDACTTNSSTFIVQLHSARRILFLAFSDLICLRRLDLARSSLFSPAFIPLCVRALGLVGKKGERKWSNLKGN